MVGAGLLTLVAARMFVGARWTATAIAAGYLAYRMVAWVLLTGGGFPPSIPPFLLIGGAIVIDLAFLALANGYLRAIAGAILATAATGAALWVAELRRRLPAGRRLWRSSGAASSWPSPGPAWPASPRPANIRPRSSAPTGRLNLSMILVTLAARSGRRTAASVTMIGRRATCCGRFEPGLVDGIKDALPTERLAWSAGPQRLRFGEFDTANPQQPKALPEGGMVHPSASSQRP